MTEGAAQKFDVKEAREWLDGHDWLDGRSSPASALHSAMRKACDRIEALEKLVGLASAWLEVDPVYPKDAEISISLMAREAFRRALEGSPE